MKLFYSLILLMMVVGRQPVFAQQPANKQPAAKQPVATPPTATSPSKTTPATATKPATTTGNSKPVTGTTGVTNSPSSSSKQTVVTPVQKTNAATAPSTTGNKSGNTTTGNSTNKSGALTTSTGANNSAKTVPNSKSTASEPKEEQSVDLAIIGDTVGVVLHADPRLAMIAYNTRHEGQVVNGKKTGSIYSSRGFRVQIYSGSDRAVASQRKVDFIRRYPGVRTYMTFIAPTFRVKVGDYRDRKSAQNMYQQVSKLYNPCMIVNDIIEVNTFRND